MSGAMRNKVQRKFKMRGYTLKVEALSEILSFVSRFPEAEDEALDLLLDELHHRSLKSSILDKESVHQVVSFFLEAEAAVEESPTSSGYDSAASALRIIDAFHFPKFRHDPIKKIFHEITTGFFSENTIVLAEGEMLLTGVFQVKTCGFPQLEDREKSLALFSGIDFFGGGSLTKEETLRLADLDTGAVKDMFVVLSDVWLDNEEVLRQRCLHDLIASSYISTQLEFVLLLSLASKVIRICSGTYLWE
ncbi:DNA polymerase epsilon subunit B2 [Forsythia ovata]|uniref:DNA polymerase epsilon subunit B2 n=1 Tax=Forsythia ovata TaxID=205694 RepID=A0ABD1X0M3_9LAMI